MNINKNATVEIKLYFITIFILCVAISTEATDNSQVRERVKKRSFQPYSSYIENQPNSISIFKAANVWKPSNYNVGRPYFIPIYGSKGRLPIFYPPQPLHGNVGTPVDNPSPPFQAPGYLPPAKETPQRNGSTSTDVKNRFGDDYDDAPVWSSAALPFAGSSSISGSGWGTGIKREKEWGYIPPTRSPSRERPTFPPLVHRPETTRQTVPPPPLPAQPALEMDIVSEIRPQQSAVPQIPSQQFVPTVPTTIRTPTTTQTLPTTTIRRGPSNCVWAIISCCSVASPAQVPHNCFEQRGCPGPFWGSSPCQSEYARAAIEVAVNYYKSNNSK